MRFAELVVVADGAMVVVVGLKSGVRSRAGAISGRGRSLVLLVEMAVVLTGLRCV